MLIRISPALGITCYGCEGFLASYLTLAPIVRGPFGPEFLRTLIGWGIAIGSLIVWWFVFRKEARVRRSGKVPPFSGSSPRLAIMALLFGAVVGLTLAVVLR